MTAPTNSAPSPSLVQHLRSIRDQLSHEIKDMTFAQERAYLDQLLAAAPAPNDEPRLAETSAA